MPSPATLDLIAAAPPVAAPTPRPQRTRRRIVSTAVPHALTIVGLLISVGAQLLLAGSDEATNATERPALVIVSAAAGASFWIGWIWWTVMAAVNARAVNSRALSPWTVPFELAFIAFASVVYGMVRQGAQYTEKADFAKLVFVTVVLITHLVVLSNFRNTAKMLGADNGDWTRVMWVPFVVGPLAMMAMIAVGASDTVLGLQVGLGVMVVGLGYWALCMHRAMATWERGVVRRAEQHESKELFDRSFGKRFG